MIFVGGRGAPLAKNGERGCMKAIRIHQFGGPEVLKLEELPDLQPGRGELLVRIKAIGVNPVDTYRRSGSNPDLKRPYTPGSDAAGLVEAVGEGVRRFKRGRSGLHRRDPHRRLRRGGAL
ncbi:MAG: alcohol dehydrogenase catalytic domain-containing protein [Candidatus Manganitrophus sp.]|nr:MAG: alcohol dehydrogenase catalytic domain-containing protein [Candidatus Manganitrophus sp.]